VLTGPESLLSDEYVWHPLTLTYVSKLRLRTGERAMNSEKIRVGIIGAGGWAKYGHIPALKTLEEFEVVAVSNRKRETAAETAKHFDIKHAFGDEQSLINHPDVDLVAVVAPAPEHARLVKQVIAAGKDVYSEWPLSTNTRD